MKVVLFNAMSVDGFIATTKDDTPWSEPIWQAYNDFIRAHGNLVVGRRTYELMKITGELVKIGSPETVVVSRTLNEPNDPKIHVARSPAEAVTKLKTLGFTEIVISGGGLLNGSFLEAGLLDEMILDIEPIILGQGISLFTGLTKQPRCKLLRKDQISPEHLRLHYQIKKSN